MNHRQTRALKLLDPELPEKEYTGQLARILGIDWLPQAPRKPRSQADATQATPEEREGLDAAVARVMGVAESDLRRVNRSHRMARARRVAWYIARVHMAMPFNELGRVYNRNHSTILRGCQTVSVQLSDPGMRARIERICRAVGIDTSLPPPEPPRD